MNYRMLWTAVLALLFAGSAATQTNYPEKPIRVIVAYPAGGAPDIAARELGRKFSDAMGKAVVIDNVPGASGTIGADRVAKAAPDGYTLGYLSIAELAIAPSISKVPYDSLKDFAPVSHVSSGYTILVVNNTVPAKNLQELVKLAKTRPGSLTFASSGMGTSPHMAGALFGLTAGIDILHVPYKGAVAAIPDLLAGRVMMMFGQPSFTLPLVNEKKVRAIAVTTPKRVSPLPQVPTIAESGYPGFEFTGWTGLFAPAGTPAAIVGKLHLETVKALATPDLRAKFAELGSPVIGSSPAEFAALIKSEVPRWAKVIKDAGIKAD